MDHFVKYTAHLQVLHMAIWRTHHDGIADSQIVSPYIYVWRLSRVTIEARDMTGMEYCCSKYDSTMVHTVQHLESW